MLAGWLLHFDAIRYAIAVDFIVFFRPFSAGWLISLATATLQFLHCWLFTMLLFRQLQSEFSRQFQSVSYHIFSISLIFV